MYVSGPCSIEAFEKSLDLRRSNIEISIIRASSPDLKSSRAAANRRMGVI